MVSVRGAGAGSSVLLHPAELSHELRASRLQPHQHALDRACVLLGAEQVPLESYDFSPPGVPQGPRRQLLYPYQLVELV